MYPMIRYTVNKREILDIYFERERKRFSLYDNNPGVLSKGKFLW